MVVNHANLGSQFYPKLVQMTSQLGMKPEDLLAVMVSESGINPSAKNPGGARGLIQFMPKTLEGVGFTGDPNEFTALSGEEQLPYIQKLIQGNMKYNGGPFTSAAQYYVANFWPVALRLPGVKNEDPSTKIVEDNPETIVDAQTGKTVSKKYHDIGVSISPQMESAAYRANPLFHGSTEGAITYGDMMRQVEKNKRTPAYRQALLAMNQSAGYQAKESPLPNTEVAGNTPPPTNNSVDNVLERYLQMVSGASAKSNKKMFKKLLSNNDLVIQIGTSSRDNGIEFARILCTALETELLATAYSHTDGERVEIECSIPGPPEECKNAVIQLSEAIAEAFKTATYKIGGIEVSLQYALNKKSSYQPISLKMADTNYRKFLLKFV